MLLYTVGNPEVSMSNIRNILFRYYQDVLRTPWKTFGWSEMLQQEYWQELKRENIFICISTSFKCI